MRKLVMKSPNFLMNISWKFYLLVCVWLTSLPGCEAKNIGVSVHGVNYTANVFHYDVKNTSIPNSDGSAELLDPYAGGGTTCCVSLPALWNPNLYLDVQAKHWVSEGPVGETHAIEEYHRVQVPQYATGEPGELWVIREPDGKISVVSSNLQPDHPNWPGKIKGWPVASLEYRRARWETYRKHEEDGVQLYISLLARLEASPERRASEAWESSKQSFPSEIAGFSGPTDLRYRAFLKQQYEEGLLNSKRRLALVMESKP